jgi:hypothetical protein
MPFRIGIKKGPGLIHAGVVFDAAQNILKLPAFRFCVVNVVCGNKRDV